MAGWHHQLDGHGSGWTPGVSDGHGKKPETDQKMIWLD